MTRFLAILRAIPHFAWAILAGLGAILMLVAGARRKGAQVGAAKATAVAETANVKEKVRDAEVKIGVALEARGRVEAAGGDGGSPEARESVVAAEAEARAASERLRNDLLERVRK